ncbi:MAG: hypothetical protein A2234_06125 [Elusimicrobia bacterium RIFOXYA2_FULL_58_8]|nr:MAG: hypothetical protein A2285_07585 [Elusimicrobia bacterium RIFOXYA12_FULL_57_11]OGS15191.1 MAG: hypothetical protein A2234_06125 [Elusimicrobia bacterium RIFOXYA2_FULL_58_8]
MPGNNALGLAVLDRGHHVVEDFAAWLFGGLALDELAGDYKPFLFSVFAEFRELRLYGQDLPVRLVSGFSGVKEIPHIKVLHTLPPCS